MPDSITQKYSVKTVFKSQAARNVAEVLAMAAIVFLYCFEFTIAYNEMDIIPYARAVYNPDWLQNDWYLGLKIPYRYLFSYVVGFFVEHFGAVKTVFVGRIITYLLFAFAFSKLLKLIIASPMLRIVLLLIYLQFFQYGLGDAGEWMIGGLDTKVFAYSFALLSLASFLIGKHKWGLFYAGLALSFHLLVGAYNLVCLTPIVLLQQSRNKGYLGSLLKSSYLFVLSGAIGLYAVYSQFSETIDSALAAKAWNIYVNIRVPHHVLPEFSISSIVVLLLLSGIAMWFLRSKIKAQQGLALYALGSVFILLMGFFVFYFLDHHYLKYYFFRTSNVILPLATLVLVASFLAEKFGEQISAKLKPKVVIPILAVAVIILQHKKVAAFGDASNYDQHKVLASTSEDAVLTDWIKANTDKNAVFLVPAYFENFYLNAERAVFVTWKHSPQTAPDILAWHSRLKLLNNNADFKNLEEINHGYYRIGDSGVQRILSAHPEIDFVVLNVHTVVGIPAIFKTQKFAVYSTADFVE